MCGRATLTRPSLADVAGELGAEFDADDARRYKARYNLAPTDLAWLLTADPAQGDRRRIVPAVWGLPSKTRPIINVQSARIERGAFRHHQHVAVIFDGFYEWAPGRRPYWYHRAAGGLLLVASVATTLAAASPRAATAFALITVDANADVAPVHDRMPALLDARALAAWLGGAPAVLEPAPDGELEARAVSRRVNRVANDDAACLEAAPEQTSGQLPLLKTT
jgi:putative SOS response-associated peptidase YedK